MRIHHPSESEIQSRALDDQGAGVSLAIVSLPVGPFPLRGLPLWPVVTASIISFLASYALSQDLFVMNEGRTYFANFGWANFISAAHYWFQPTGFNTRFTSMYFASFVGHQCGVDVSCTNMWESLLFAAAFATVILHTFQLLGKIKLTLFAATLWLFSAPALSGILWQSIQHDKIALCLTLLTLSATLEFFRAPRRTTYRIVFSLALTALFGVAFNAKEVAFLLPICATLLAVLLALPDMRQVWANLAVMALPVAYSAWYITYYFRHLSAAWSDHIAGGSPLQGMASLILLAAGLGNFFSLGRWSTYSDAVLQISKWLYVLFFAALFALLIHRLTRGRTPAERQSLLQWCASWWRELYLCSVFTICLLALARTRVPSVFYMMIPFWAMAVLLVLVLERLTTSLRHSRPIFLMMLVLISAPLLLANSTFYAPGGPVPRLLETSRALESTLQTVRTLLRGRNVSSLKITVEGEPDCVWYLLHGARGENIDVDLGPYIMGDISAHPVIIDGNDAQHVSAPLSAGAAEVELGKQYQLRRLTFEGKDIVRSD